MNRFFTSLSLVVSLIASSITYPANAAGPVAASPATIHVALYGRDTDDGTAERPFATLIRARDEVRKRKAAGSLPNGAITIMVHGGRYVMADGLELTGEDSGSASRPVIYQALPGQEVQLTSDRLVKASDFAKVTDHAMLQRLDVAAREHIVELDLSRLDIKHAKSFPNSFDGGGGLLQLHFNAERLPLSRWPNGGYTTMGEVIDNGDTKGGNRHGGAFQYRDERPARWKAALDDDGVWLAGFWRVPWVITTLRTATIDPEKHLITLAVPTSGGIGSKYSKVINGVRKGTGKENFYALNLAEEIDRPGEWCVSFKRRKLYLWPPAPLEGADIRISDSEKPIVALKGAAWITLRGFTLEGGLGNTIEIQGGSDNLVTGCTVHHNGGIAVVLKDGARNGVKNSDLFHLGDAGITLAGGNRQSLDPGGLYAINNHIHHIGEVKKIGAGINCEGFGNRVANNLIHDTPYNGIQYRGNEHVMELNELYHLGLDGGDLGAFYTNGDWASCQNVIRNNFIHHAPGAQGVYWDDGHSGDRACGNIFYKTQSGAFVGGGHDNLFDNNLVVDCRMGLHVDSRGISRNYNWKSANLSKMLTTVNYTRPPWSQRYPFLLTRFNGRPEYPEGTTFQRNLVWNCTKSIDLSGKPEHFDKTRVIDNQVVTQNPGLEAPERLDFRFRPSAKPFIDPIPFGKIGLQIEGERKTLPKDSEIGRNEDCSGVPVFDSKTDMEQSNRDAVKRK